MTNKEKYKQAFSAIHTSNTLHLEVEKLERKHRQVKFKTLAATVAAIVLVAGSATAAYAANVGGIQRTIQLWIHGDRTEATVTFDGNGNYSMDYIDSQGNEAHRSGGGVAMGPDGSERPATEEELMAELMAPEVDYKDDGSVWVYWRNQSLDITDKFENGVCYVQLVSGDETLYMTVKYQNGYATSPNKYPKASEFNR